MRAILHLAILAIVASPIATFAGSSASNAHIKSLAINKGMGTFVLIAIDVVPTGTPACDSTGWGYTLTLTNPGDNQLYAMLLAAYTSGATVSLTGTGSCSEWGSIESLLSAQLMP